LSFDEVSVNDARARGWKSVVVFVPLEHAESLRGAPTIEILGDNGKTAVLGWKP
jgi:hypothetical protein